MRTPGVRVPKEQAEGTRRRLAAAGVLRRDLAVAHDDDAVVFPVTEGAAPPAGATLLEHEFQPIERPPRGYQDVVDLPDDLKVLLPTSFDVIGHVVVLKLPPELDAHAAAIGDALLAATPRARTVAVDRGVKGELRVRHLDVVAGDADTETTYVESGMRLKVDPAEAYFSPRLAFERSRVAGLVEEGEVVADLFAGVGPWAILMARTGRPARVWAVDLNPRAVAYLAENVRANGVSDVVVPVEADARVFAAEHAGEADRVVANLPHDAHRFLDAGLTVLKPEGVLHHHAILGEGDVDAHVAALQEEAARYDRRLALLERRIVRAYSPTSAHWALDLQVNIP